MLIRELRRARSADRRSRIWMPRSTALRSQIERKPQSRRVR